MRAQPIALSGPKDYGVATSARPDGQEVSLALEILRRQAKSTSGAPLGLGGIDILWAASYSQLESLGGHRSALAAAAGWYGRVAEWSNAPVLKTGVPQGTGGSNPSPTAWQMFDSCPHVVPEPGPMFHVGPFDGPLERLAER